MTITRARRQPDRGFTLLEMLAVVLLMALLMTFALPQLGAMRASALRSEARTLASELEYARQEAVVKGVAHRVLIEVDTGGYRVERLASDEGAANDPFEQEELDLRGSTPLALTPPAPLEFSYQPVDNSFGGNEYLGKSFHFAGVQTAEGFYEEGDVGIVFDRDGTSDHVEIVIADDDGMEVSLEVEPLLEVVRIHDAE